MTDPLLRFWAKVRISPGCWEWQGGLNHNGYGWHYLNNRHIFAHRYIYTVTVGPIPPGMIVCHRCDNPRCVRPSHLFLGTHADNSADKVAKGRQRYGNDPAALARRSGEHHYAAKLTADQVADIRHLYTTTPLTQQELAARFGVHRSAVGKIVRHEKWKALA